MTKPLGAHHDFTAPEAVFICCATHQSQGMPWQAELNIAAVPNSATGKIETGDDGLCPKYFLLKHAADASFANT